MALERRARCGEGRFLKILHLDTGREWRGEQQQIFHLTQGLEERGIVSVVATPMGSALAQRLRDHDLPVIELPPGSPFAPRSVRALHGILADRHWHLLHAHSAHAHTLGFLSFRLPPARSFHRPAFIVSRRVDFVPARDPLTRLKYTGAGQTFVCVSSAVAEVLRHYGVPECALRVVHDGVPVPGSPDPYDSELPDADAARIEQERADLRAELNVPEQVPLIGNIAPFAEHKGHRYLLEAMARVRAEEESAHLVLLGKGELEKTLRHQAESLALTGALTFTGFRPDAVRYLPAMDVFALASVEEGLGIPILSAQAAGVPVVGTTAGGLPEAVADGVSGILVQPKAPDALASAILRLLRDRSLRARMGQAGRKWVSDHFAVSRMVDETLLVYRDALGRV